MNVCGCFGWMYLVGPTGLIRQTGVLQSSFTAAESESRQIWLIENWLISYHLYMHKFIFRLHTEQIRFHLPTGFDWWIYSNRIHTGFRCEGQIYLWFICTSYIYVGFFTLELLAQRLLLSFLHIQMVLNLVEYWSHSPWFKFHQRKIRRQLESWSTLLLQFHYAQMGGVNRTNQHSFKL